MTHGNLMVTKPLRILYIGPDAGTCRQRFDALRRLGHDAYLVDPFAALPGVGLMRTWSFKTGGFGLAGMVERHILDGIGARHFDIAYVDSGELIGPSTLHRLRRRATHLVNYNPDNPYSARDGWRWRLFRQALPGYDLVFVPRASNLGEAKAAGARAVSRVWFAADDALRDAELPAADIPPARFTSPVSFVGTWMPERGGLLLDLIRRGVPLRIFGPRWDRAPEFADLAAHTSVGELSPIDYHAAVAAADISIALLSKGNHDEHTTRSMEIPALGSMLCGERTSEHELLYRDGHEAILWSSAEECADACHALIADPARRMRIARAGRARAIANDHFNEPLMRAIVARTMAISDEGDDAADRHAEATV